MHNELFTIGPFTVYGYGLMIAIGIIAAYYLAEYRAKRIEGLDVERVFGLTCFAVVGGIIGGKLLFYVTILPKIASEPSLLYTNLTSGFIIYGALIGGFAGILIYCRHWKMKIRAYLDLALPSVALAQGFGRIGCLLAGCCYGKETDSPLGIVFQNSDYAPNGVALIPTQIMSSVLDFLHFGLLMLFVKKAKKADGQVTGLYFMCYSAGRFILEFFRGDLARGTVGALSTSQFIAIFAFAFGAWFFWKSTKEESAKAQAEAEGISITLEGKDGPTAIFLAGKTKKGSLSEREQKLEEFAEKAKELGSHTLEEVETWIQEKYDAKLSSGEDAAVHSYRITPASAEADDESNVTELALDFENDQLQLELQFTDEEQRLALEQIRREIYTYYGVTEEDASERNVRFLTLAAVLEQI